MPTKQLAEQIGSGSQSRLMSSELSSADDAVPPRITQQIDAICDEFESALRLGLGVELEPYLGRIELAAHEPLLKELALLALHQLRQHGATDPLTDLLQANPALHEELKRLTFVPDNPSTVLMTTDSSRSVPGPGLVIRCPHCHNTIEMIVDASLVDIGCPNCGGSFSLVNDSEKTRDATSFTKIAHFELIERLGMGEFGTVWKARDTILERTVALKIPRREHLDPLSIGKVMREAARRLNYGTQTSSAHTKWGVMQILCTSSPSISAACRCRW